MWRAHANNLYTNWLNYYVYQTTPFVLDEHHFKRQIRDREKV